MSAVLCLFYDFELAFFWRVKVYSLIVVVFIVVGSTLKVDLVWELADFFNGLMVIPNALALLALGGVVVNICKKFGK